MINTLSIIICFTCRNFFNGANYISEMVNIIYRFLSKKIENLCSLNHPILFKFCQFVVKIVSQELQKVFLTYTVSNSNGNLKELDRKNPCKKSIFLVTVANPDIGNLKFYL